MMTHQLAHSAYFDQVSALPLYMETYPAFTTQHPCFPTSMGPRLLPSALTPLDVVVPTKTLKFNGFTFLAPKLEHITSPPEKKDHCLAQTIQVIKLSSDSPQTKFLALSSCFQHLPLAAKHAQNKMLGLQDLCTPGVFHFSATRVLDIDCTVVNVDLAPHMIDNLKC